jgi:hypothetical protein
LGSQSLKYLSKDAVRAFLIVCLAFAGCAGDFESPQKKRDAEATAQLVGFCNRVVREQEAERQRYLKEVERFGIEKFLAPTVLTNREAIRQARVSLSEFDRIVEQELSRREAGLQAYIEELGAMFAHFGKSWVTKFTEALDSNAPEVYAVMSEQRQLHVQTVAELAALFDFVEQRVGQTKIGPDNRIAFPTQADLERYNAFIRRLQVLAEQQEAIAETISQKQSESAENLRKLTTQVEARRK